MKILLTVLLPDAVSDENAPEQTELISYNGEKPLNEAVKRARGKYSVISEGDLECDLNGDFFALLDKENADIVQFSSGYCIKTSLIKGCKTATDKFRAEVFAALSAKTAIKSTLSPFSFSGELCPDGARISEAFDEFNKAKAKLNKEVYAFVSELICGVAVRYYARAILDLHDGKISVDELTAFDEKLKENTVFYHTVEKRFTYASLQKLRKKSFKTNFFDCLLLKNKLKK